MYRKKEPKPNKKDGYRQRNVCQFLHILASPGYALGQSRKMLHGWKEDSMLVKASIFNRLRAIARYCSEIATFSYPFAFNAPVGGVPIGIPGKHLNLKKLESWGYQAVKTV